MNIRIAIAVVAAITAIGTRIYQVFNNNESFVQSSTRNHLLRNALNSTQQTIRHNDNSSLLNVVLPTTGLGILTIYDHYNSEFPVAPSSFSVIQPTIVPERDNLLEDSVEVNSEDETSEEEKSEEIPEEFLDPITYDIMTDPVIAITTSQNRDQEQRTTHVYDRATFERLGGVCPENRLDFIEMRPHTELKNRIDEYTQGQNSARQPHRSFEI